MSVTPNDLFQLASELTQTAATEVQFRNAIGRAYYFCYHFAGEFHASLPSPGQPPTDSVGNHAELAHRLQNPTISKDDPRYKVSRILGTRLPTFHALRVKADYRLDVAITKNDSRDAIIKAVGIRGQIAGKV